MTQAAVGSADILAEANTDKREEVVELLQKAYWMEIETVMSYIAGSVNPDGIRAQEIKESLETDIAEELDHAKQFAQRIKDLYGVVPGSDDFTAEQSFLQPADDQIDIVTFHQRRRVGRQQVRRHVRMPFGPSHRDPHELQRQPDASGKIIGLVVHEPGDLRSDRPAAQ